MSDEQQPEEMRPIPDGGLKDAMPSWLKRPPAWRSMPTAEQRHERRLPEPDTSEIDPKTLIDVSDLPQWLQAIAAREDLPAPEPGESVGHAVEQVQAVTAARQQQKSELESAPEEPQPDEEVAEMSAKSRSGKTEIGLLTDEPGSPQIDSGETTRVPKMSPALIMAIGIVILVLGLLVYFLI